MRIPLPPLDAQRAYGETFRRLGEFTRAIRAAHDLGSGFVQHMTDLVTSALKDNTGTALST